MATSLKQQTSRARANDFRAQIEAVIAADIPNLANGTAPFSSVVAGVKDALRAYAEACLSSTDNEVRKAALLVAGENAIVSINSDEGAGTYTATDATVKARFRALVPVLAGLPVGTVLT